MKEKLPREFLWTEKRRMDEFLKEPLNRKLYELYLNLKRNAPSQDYHTLELFNEVYYLCSCIVYNDDPNATLNDYIDEIKTDMGWDYSTSLVINMIYAVLSLREDNSKAVEGFLSQIRNHYRLSMNSSPFSKLLVVSEPKVRIKDITRKSILKRIRNAKERLLPTVRLDTFSSSTPIIVKANKVVMMNPTIQGPVNSITKNKNVKL